MYRPTFLGLLASATWLFLGVNAADSNYFMLESPKGCMGRRTDGTDALVLLECDPQDDNVLWRRDPATLPLYNRFRSYADDTACVQVEKQPELGNGTATLGRGAKLFTKPCAPIGANSPKEAFQAFDAIWESGPLTLVDRPDLCVVHSGAEPVLGDARILLIACDELGGPQGRVEGWAIVPVAFDYVILDSLSGNQRGGCMGRSADGSDELLYKTCRSDDDTVQWRLDNEGRLRSKVDDTECLQAEERPEILQDVDNLMRGSRVYVKPCAIPGSLKEDFQLIDASWNSTGLMRLQYRPDLCIVHFGADPVVGESRIMLVECDTLGGARAEGWEATDPCATPPTCNARSFNLTESESNATIPIFGNATLIVDDDDISDASSIGWEGSTPTQF